MTVKTFKEWIVGKVIPIGREVEEYLTYKAKEIAKSKNKQNNG